MSVTVKNNPNVTAIIALLSITNLVFIVTCYFLLQYIHFEEKKRITDLNNTQSVFLCTESSGEIINTLDDKSSPKECKYYQVKPA